jgi:hypothetical protein
VKHSRTEKAIELLYIPLCNKKCLGSESAGLCGQILFGRFGKTFRKLIGLNSIETGLQLAATSSLSFLSQLLGWFWYFPLSACLRTGTRTTKRPNLSAYKEP